MKEKDIDKVRTQMRRGVLELCILSTITEGEAYTSDILTNLKASDLLITEGTLYPLLSRLKNQNLVQYNWKESNEGPPRKYYQITEEGRSFLIGLLETWNNLVAAVQQSTKNIITNE
ncbi:MAG: PadR family transcriptional regulator [Saprospiraceae bacterium]|nr:MAG: PadR family transcriptional regulator [Saprospiraceae bacterium]